MVRKAGDTPSGPAPQPEISIPPYKRPKTGGRKPGSPMKRTEQAREIADRMGFHPVEFLCHVALHGEMPNPDGPPTKVDNAARLDAAKSVAPYLVPKLSASQVTGPNEGPVEMVMSQEQVANLMKDPAKARTLSELALLVASQDGAEVHAN